MKYHLPVSRFVQAAGISTLPALSFAQGLPTIDPPSRGTGSVQSTQRVRSLYDRMDSAYSSEIIRAHSRVLGYIAAKTTVQSCPANMRNEHPCMFGSIQRKSTNFMPWLASLDRENRSTTR